MVSTLETMTATHPLDDVVRAITRLGERPNLSVYVERRGTRFRWSIAHGGGPYPLSREVCLFLGVSHHGFVVPCQAVGRVSIVSPDSALGTHVDAHGFVEPASDEATVRERVIRVCGLGDSRDEQGDK